MKIYLLIESYDYESDEVLGVYSTLQKARENLKLLYDNGDSIYTEEKRIDSYLTPGGSVHIATHELDKQIYD